MYCKNIHMTEYIDLYSTEYYITINKTNYDLFEEIAGKNLKQFERVIKKMKNTKKVNDKVNEYIDEVNEYIDEDCCTCKKMSFNSDKSYNYYTAQKYIYIKKILELLNNKTITDLANIIFNYLIIFRGEICKSCTYIKLIKKNILFCDGQYRHKYSNSHKIIKLIQKICPYQKQLSKHIAHCNINMICTDYKNGTEICEKNNILVKQKNTYLLYNKIIIEEVHDLNALLEISKVVHVLDRRLCYGCDTSHIQGGEKEYDHDKQLIDKNMVNKTKNVDVKYFLKKKPFPLYANNTFTTIQIISGSQCYADKHYDKKFKTKNKSTNKNYSHRKR